MVRGRTACTRQADVRARVHAAGNAFRPSIEKHVRHLALAVIDQRFLMSHPEARLVQNIRPRFVREIACQRNLLQKPQQPRRHIRRSRCVRTSTA